MQKIRNWQIEWATKEGYIERERDTPAGHPKEVSQDVWHKEAL